MHLNKALTPRYAGSANRLRTKTWAGDLSHVTSNSPMTNTPVCSGGDLKKSANATLTITSHKTFEKEV
jgi:hypothetical protein